MSKLKSNAFVCDVVVLGGGFCLAFGFWDIACPVNGVGGMFAFGGARNPMFDRTV